MVHLRSRDLCFILASSRPHLDQRQRTCVKWGSSFDLDEAEISGDRVIFFRGTGSNEPERKRQRRVQNEAEITQELGQMRLRGRSQEEAETMQRSCDLSLRGTGSNKAKRTRLRRGQDDSDHMISATLPFGLFSACSSQPLHLDTVLTNQKHRIYAKWGRGWKESEIRKVGA